MPILGSFPDSPWVAVRFVVVTRKTSSCYSVIGQRGSRGVHNSPSLSFLPADRLFSFFYPVASPTRGAGCMCFLTPSHVCAGVCDSCLLWREARCLGFRQYKAANIATFVTFCFRFSYYFFGLALLGCFCAAAVLVVVA